MKIRKVDDKPMVIHTKEKAKIHAHEPKGAKIKGSNIYTVERGPKTAGAKVTDTDRKKSYRKSTIHQSEPKNKGLSRFKQNLKESNTSIKTKNTNLHIAGRTGALVAGAVTDQVEGGQEVSQAAYLAYEANVTVSARFCLDDIQLGHFLQGFYNDSKEFRFDKEASSYECVAKLKEIIFELFLDGKGYTQIAKCLNEHGIMSPFSSR